MNLVSGEPGAVLLAGKPLACRARPTARSGKPRPRHIPLHMRLLIAFFLGGSLCSSIGYAQQTAPSAPRSMSAVRRSGPVTIDGKLDEAAWANAPVSSGFTESYPAPGKPAPDQTEVRVLYDDAALYVGIRMYDAHPDSIAAGLARRDATAATGIYSDWVHLIIDSYHDRRTAFRFSTTPRAVQKDVYTSTTGTRTPTGTPSGRSRRASTRRGGSPSIAFRSASSASAATRRGAASGDSRSSVTSRVATSATPGRRGRGTMAASSRASATSPASPGSRRRSASRSPRTSARPSSASPARRTIPSTSRRRRRQRSAATSSTGCR